MNAGLVASPTRGWELPNCWPWLLLLTSGGFCRYAEADLSSYNSCIVSLKWQSLARCMYTQLKVLMY